MGKAVNTVGKVATLGMVNNASDMLLGKEDEGTADRRLSLDPSLKAVVEKGRGLQGTALDKYKDLLNADVKGLAGSQIAAQEAAARAGVEDQSRLAQKMIAQRGMQGTAAGLTAAMAPQKELGEKIGNIRAGQGILEHNLKTQNLANASSGINAILGAQGAQSAYVMGREGGGRKGGLAPLLGGIAGGVMGGAGGAQAGMGMGQMATQLG
jgi:hypothetical protein